MVSWASSLIVAFALLIGGALYVRFRWYRSPQAYRAMIGLGACYFVAGSIVGAWMLNLVSPRSPQVATPSPSVAAPAPAISASTQPLNPPNEFSAKVTNITDGDTIDVLGSITPPTPFASLASMRQNMVRPSGPNRLNISPR